MTEAEARTKRCCGPRILAAPMLASGNVATLKALTEHTEDFGACRGSDCMAWRKIVRRHKVVGGYCGLAGQP